MSQPLKRTINLENPIKLSTAKKIKQDAVGAQITVAVNAAAAAAQTSTAPSASTDLEFQLPAMMIRQAEGGDSGVANATKKCVKYKLVKQVYNKNTLNVPVAVAPCTTATTTVTGVVPTYRILPNSLLQSKVKQVVIIPNNNVAMQYQNKSSAQPATPTQLNTTSNVRTGVVATPIAEMQMQQVSLCDFDADEIDMQKTDSDEDGYSNIDFNDDDYQVIESEETVDKYDPVWTQTVMKSCRVFNYAGEWQTKLKEAAPYAPISYFDLIIGSRAQFFTKLANSCNARALKKLGNVTNFKSFTSEELQIFMGICLQMSSQRLHRLEQYWDGNANFSFNGFGDKMLLKRFKTILNVLNFDMFPNNATASTTSNLNNGEQFIDKFADIRPLLSYFNSRMENLYNFDRHLILNEPVLYWKGKLNWLNEVKVKFRCNAIMLHFLTEPSGILLRIVPDMESIERKVLTRDSKSLALQRLAIALEVLQANMEKGHIVYTSKHYSSYALALELAKRQTYCAGFLESNRYGNSKELIFTPLDKGCVIARHAGDIMMGKYRHCRKSIYFYSSDCQNVLANERQNIQSALKNVVKDIKTHLCSQPDDIRSKILNCQMLLPCTEIKWDKRLMIYVMNLIVLNAHLIYTKYAKFDEGETPLRYEQFRQEIIASLLNTSLESYHILQILPLLDGKVVKKKCQICCKGGLTTYSKYFCETCPGQPALCEKPCYKIWHDQLHKSAKALEFEDADI